jgi:hypothetical protein
MAEALARQAVATAWSLTSLAEEAEFDRHIDIIAGAIASHFTLKVHQNVVHRRMAYVAWIDDVAGENLGAIDYRSFVSVCASLIGSIARHRVVSFSAMIRDPASRTIGTVLRYPNEVSALFAGAALYKMRVAELTGASTPERLPPMILENAAANLARHPEAAARFRELLQLGTPWT